jgi:Gpi18-like mannosyltransferase
MTRIMCGLAVTTAAAAVPTQRRPAQMSGLALAAVLALALCAHALYWSTRPPDMSIFLEPWLAHIVHHGPIKAFAHPFSNYEPAYLYLLAAGSLAHDVLSPMDIIKLLSVAGSLFLTFAVADLLKTLGASPRLAAFTLVLPTVVINAALLGQCDALWGGSCVLALAAMMRGETVLSLVWCGIAMAFKSQAAFIAPVIIGAMIGRRAPLWQWAIPTAVFFATLVPAWLAGWPLNELLMVYPGQAALVQFPGKLGNPWMFATIFADHVSRPYFFVGYVAAMAAGMAIIALAARSVRDRRMLLLLALLSATALPFLLPKMLERYYFLGDVLALALALSFATPRAVKIAIAIQLASLMSLLTYIYWYHWPYPALAGTLFAAAGLAGTLALIRENGVSRRQAPAISRSILPA